MKDLDATQAPGDAKNAGGAAEAGAEKPLAQSRLGPNADSKATSAKTARQYGHFGPFEEDRINIDATLDFCGTKSVK